MIHPAQKRLDILYITVVIFLLSIFAYTETEHRNNKTLTYSPPNTTTDPAKIKPIHEKQDSLPASAHVRSSEASSGKNTLSYN